MAAAHLLDELYSTTPERYDAFQLLSLRESAKDFLGDEKRQ